MRLILYRIERSTQRGPDAVIDALQLHSEEWRQSFLGKRAQDSGITRWRLSRSGSELLLRPQWKRDPFKLVVGTWRVNFVVRVTPASDGARVIVQAIPSTVLELELLATILLLIALPLLLLGIGAVSGIHVPGGVRGALLISGCGGLWALALVSTTFGAREAAREFLDRALEWKSGAPTGTAGTSRAVSS